MVAYANTHHLSMASSGGVGPSPATAVVRLFSLHNKRAMQSPTSKVVHLVRHAEGTHNLNEEESKLPLHHDARLTPRGVEQCNALARRTKDLEVQAVLVSPLTRCLETSRLSFPHLYEDDGDPAPVPFVAHEEWRETVNFLCDSRRSASVLKLEYPRVSFDNIRDYGNGDDNNANGYCCDPLWSYYERIHGSHSDHRCKRESDDPNSLYSRAHQAWNAVLERPEKKLALVGHSAFFMHMFTPLFDELKGLVEYADDDVRRIMTADKFANCELRSVVIDTPI